MKKILSGKVREVYEAGENRLLIEATDRISAFDVILPSTIKDKGIALTQISNFWFDFTKGIIPNHLLSTEVSPRTVLVKKLEILPYEFIVRGYMFGSLWKEHRTEGVYQLAERLPEPIVTPQVKNNTGHDENIPLERLRQELGTEEADKICQISLRLYEACSAYALQKGIIVADTKFEFGYDETGVLTLGDEMLTPDSSRFWDAEEYQVGVSPKSYDKQFVRDWLIEQGLDGVEPGPELPEEVVRETGRLYKKCFQSITGKAEY